MMKRAMAVAAVSIVFGAHAAGAAENRINLKANVPAFCELSKVGGGSNDYPIQITEAHSVDDREFTISYNVLCNGDASLDITSTNGGLWLGNTGTITGFDSVINYGVITGGTAALNGDAINASTSDVPAFGSAESLGGHRPFAGNAVNGTLTITIKPEPNGNTLLAGQYSDVLVVSVVAE